jgi:hypothetical protein
VFKEISVKKPMKKTPKAPAKKPATKSTAAKKAAPSKKSTKAGGMMMPMPKKKLY